MNQDGPLSEPLLRRPPPLPLSLTQDLRALTGSVGEGNHQAETGKDGHPPLHPGQHSVRRDVQEGWGSPEQALCLQAPRQASSRSGVVSHRTQHSPSLQCSRVRTSHHTSRNFLPRCARETPTTTALVALPALPLSKHLGLSATPLLSLSPVLPSWLPALPFSSFPESALSPGESRMLGCPWGCRLTDQVGAGLCCEC